MPIKPQSHQAPPHSSDHIHSSSHCIRLPWWTKVA
jgi:hypothetical protein